ncbi:MAG: poly-gamma-glutamate biosynthesis protein PgsC/CapC [Acidimicrobiales bacterium]
MISPGWLALLLVDDPARALIVASVIVVTFLAMNGLQRVVILYGKRLFATVVLVAVFLQVTVSLFLYDLFPTFFATTTLGFIVPGLVAYQLIRQPIGATVVSMAAVTALTYAVVISGVLLQFIPSA